MRSPLRRAAALAVVAGLAGATAAPARADTLTDLARRLGELRKRVELWIALADQDADAAKITRYKAQTKDDFAKKRDDRVTALDILQIVTNTAKENKKIRLDASEALEGAALAGLDPDLEPPKSKGKPSKRAQFAEKNLIKWLTDKKGDLVTRGCVDRILNKWFLPSGRNGVAISMYDPGVESTWQPAFAAWRDVIREG
jgi:hypothetical protein